LTDSKRTARFASRQHVALWAAALFVWSGGGCTRHLGPRAVKWERTHYNLAIQETDDTQLLLNLVRLKYRDTPVFLELNGIVSQFTFESAAEAGAELQKPSDLWKLGLSARFSAQPTITYAPLQGEKFAQQLLSPLKIETLMLLYRSGWPLKRVLHLCVQRLNRLENAARASGPTPELAPRYEEFALVLELIAELNHRGQLDLVYETLPTTKESARIVMEVDPEAVRLPETQELWKRLRLVPEKVHYPVTYQLVEHAGERELDHLEVETRSLLGVLFFLSQAVEAPAVDIQAGRITITRTQRGEVFDWKNVTRQLLRIQSTATRPARPATSVQYRGSWFYLADSDLSSKSTFALLTQLVALQSGEVTRLTPVLTVPVGK
jgi:hypothetical protein